MRSQFSPTRPALAVCLAASLAVTAPGCGGDSTSPTSSSTSTTGADASTDAGGGGGTGGGGTGSGGGSNLQAGPVTTEEFALAVGPVFDVASGGQITTQVKGIIVKPDACTAATKCPVMVVVGDYDQPPFPTYLDGAKQLAGALKVGVILFNLPGRGDAQYTSGDKKHDDIGGPLHYTAVRDVMKLKTKGDWVDVNRLGYLTIGTGLAPVVKAIKTFGTVPPLDKLRFLIDIEGPVDRCDTSQAPADPQLGIGPDDGPGVSKGACHFPDDQSHSVFYPPAKDGKPASIVCSESAWPISKSGANCQDGSWWADREPHEGLKAINFRYQRLQFKYDHRMPSYAASRKAMLALTSAKSPYFQINNMEACGPAFSDEDCVGLPCWLEGAYGNGLAPAPFAGADFKPISPTALMTQVLPGYVQRMLDDTLKCP